MSIFQFLMTYDFKRHWKQIVCDLIYVHNEYKIQPVQVEFLPPQELDQRPDIDDDPNTYTPAKINPDQDHRMKPQETGFMYRRLPLAILRRNPQVRIVAPQFPFKTYEILDQINRHLDSNLTELDLIDETYESLEGEILIHAKPTSHVWIGFRDIIVTDGVPRKVIYPVEETHVWLKLWNIEEEREPQITAAANEINDLAWVLDQDYSFGQVEDIPPLDTEFGQNTRIFIYSNMPDYDDQWLYYRRFNPSEILEMLTEEEQFLSLSSTTPTLTQVLDAFYNLLGLTLTSEDILSFSFNEEDGTLTVDFRFDSLAFRPGRIVIPARHVIPVPYLRLSEEGVPRRSADNDYRQYQNWPEPS